MDPEAKGTTASAPKTYTEEEVTAIRTKADNATAQLVDLQKKVDQWTALGFSPEEIKGKLEDYNLIRKEGAGSDQGKIDELIAEAVGAETGKWKKTLTDVEKERDDFRTRAHKAEVMNPALTEAAKHFRPDGLKLITPILEQSLGMVDGKIVVVKDGKPVSSADPRNGNMGLAEFLKTLAGEYESIALPNGSPGGKSPGDKTTASGKTMTLADIKKLPSNEQKEVFKQIGPEGVKALF
jgi:hypothetical protein